EGGGWAARRMVHHMRYADELAETQAFEDARRIIERQRERMEIRTATIARREAALPGRVLARAASGPRRRLYDTRKLDRLAAMKGDNHIGDAGDGEDVDPRVGEHVIGGRP